MLIALLVLSLGLLGVAGLQALSLKNNQSAYLRTQANFWAYEIIDRMRANRVNALSGNYNKGNPFDPGPSDLPSSDSTTDRAVSDLYQWRNELAELPSGLGAVNCADGVCVVGVEWDESRGGGSALRTRLVVSTAL